MYRVYCIYVYMLGIGILGICKKVCYTNIDVCKATAESIMRVSSVSLVLSDEDI